MRLLMITQDFPPDVGGIQTYSYELAQRFASRCEDFAVLAPMVDGAEAVDAALPFEVIRVRATYNTFAIKVFPVLRKLARERGFDTAFHAQWTTGIASVAARAQSWPKRLYIAAHARELLLEPLPTGLNGLYNAFRRFVLRRADGFIAVSRYTGSLLERNGVEPERIRVAHSGVDPMRYAPQDVSAFRKSKGLEGRRVLLTVSRLVLRKGIDTVIRALPTVAAADPAVLYLIGGSGPDRDRLEALVRECNVQEHVRFEGMIPEEEMPHYYSAADAFVMPAREDGPNVEGFGLVFLEANACETPVIGSRTGGIADAILEGETGLLVDPDNPDALAAVLLALLSDPDKAANMGRKGRARILRESTWDHAADRTFSVLSGRSLNGEGHPPRG